MIISPAMLKIFEECPQKYKFMYVDKISLPQNKYFFEKGKKIHAIASYYIKGFDVGFKMYIIQREWHRGYAQYQDSWNIGKNMPSVDENKT